MGVFECVGVNKITPTESTEVFTISMASNTTLNEPRRDVDSPSSQTRYRRHSIWWTFGIDLPLLGILLLLAGLFELGVIPTHKTGYYCNDAKLSYPFTGDTVTTEILMSTLFVIPFAIIILTEFTFVDSMYQQSRLRTTLINTFYLYRTYIYGFIINFSIMEVMKGIMGNPRPDFFALCQPVVIGGEACSNSSSHFVSSFTCTDNQYGWWLQMDSYRSFPSGHTSLSVYCGFFTAWYLQRRAFNWSHRTIFLVPILQILCISYSAICSLTRITDHRHHWWDVLVGSILGIASVIYAVIISSNFTSDHSKADLKSQESRHTEKTFIYEQRRETV